LPVSDSLNKEDELVEKVSSLIVDNGMEVPATLFLEFGRMSGLTHSLAQITYSWTSWLFGLHPDLSKHSVDIMQLTSNPKNIKRILDRIEEKHNDKRKRRVTHS
jgi:hypothetical protein